jgi:hypothetical protein
MSTFGYGQNQLFRRPSPATSGGLQVVHLYAWNYNTFNTVATETWTSVCGLEGTFLDGFYEEVFYTDGFSTAWDCDAGTILMGTDAEYLLQGWVQFNEDASDGEQRFVAINFGSGNRHIQEYVANPNSLGNLALHLPVHTFWLENGSGTTAYLEVWHDHGSDITIRGAEFSVKRFSLVADGVVEICN